MKQKLHRLSVILISWFFITLSLFSQDYVTVDEKFESSDFRNKIEILEDKGGILNISDVVKTQTSQNFFRSPAEIPNLGISDSVFWIKIRIQNRTAKPKDVILEYSFSLVDSVDLYAPEKKNEFKVYKSGNSVPLSEREINSRHFLFPITLQNFDQEYYFRVKSRDGIFVPIKLWDHEKFYESHTKADFVQGAYFGLIFVMFIYNLFIFISTKDRSYLVYIIYLFFTSFLLQASLQGFTNEILFPSRPELSIQFQLLFCILAVLSIYPLIMYTLMTRINAPVFHRLLQILWTATFFSFPIFYIWGYSIANTYANILVFAAGFTALLSAVYLSFKKIRQAYFFLIAFSLVITSGLVLLATFLGFFELNFFILNSYQAAQALEAALMGFALADRINTVTIEKEIAYKNSYENQKIALENLEKFNEMKNNLFAGISHELLTPLNGIIGIAESLRSGSEGTLSSNVMQNLHLIMSNGKRLSNMVGNLFDLSNLFNNNIVLEPSVFNLNDFVYKISEAYSAIAKRKNIQLALDIPDSLFTEADKNRVFQVFNNLISNALKSITVGEIRVSARTYQEDAGKILVTVSDTGPGLPKEIRELVFNDYSDFTPLEKGKSSGFGFSMILTKKIIELHGCDIWMDAKSEKGSVFYFTMPAAKKVPASTEEKKAAAQESSQKKQEPDKQATSVLIVDDEPINLYVLESHLEKEGYKVLQAVNGYEAQDICNSERRPDILLLDVMMPGIDGFEVVRNLRKKYSLHELPIILLTAKNTMLDVQEGFDAGANDFLNKPFDRIELLSRVNTLITLKRSVSENQKHITIQHELAIARKLQKSLLPASKPDMAGIEMEARYIPMTYLGGDYYDYHISRENQLGVIIADVTGHGVAAAMIASMLKTAFQVQRQNFSRPAYVLEQINKIMYGNELLTATYIVIDLNENILRVANAGHPHLYVAKKDGQIISLNPKGKLIGFFPEIKCEEIWHPIETGDRIILYTDGLVEATDIFGEPLGDEKFTDFIHQNIHLDAKEFISSALGFVFAWSGKEEPDDDLTLLVIDITASTSKDI